MVFGVVGAVAGGVALDAPTFGERGGHERVVADGVDDLGDEGGDMAAALRIVVMGVDHDLADQWPDGNVADLAQRFRCRRPATCLWFLREVADEAR